MRTAIIMLLCTLCMIWGNEEVMGQTFRLQPDATYLSEEGKEFVVVYFPGKSAHDLYQQVLGNVTLTYNSPKDVVSTQQDMIISVNGLAKDFGYIGTVNGRYYYNMMYVISFQFKDEKVRINAPSISMFYFDEEKPFQDLPRWLRGQGVFDKKGTRATKGKSLRVLESFEDAVNNIITTLLSAQQSTQDGW